MKRKTITVFAQLCNLLPRTILIDIARKYKHSGDGRRFNAVKFNEWDLLIALLFGHGARCTSLRGIEDGLASIQDELHHIQQAQFLCRSTFSYLNNRTNYKVFEEYYHALVKLFEDQLGKKLPSSYQKPIFSLDSTTITTCLSLFPWAKYRSTKGGFKLHTVLSHDIQVPTVSDLSEGRVADVTQAKKAICALPTNSYIVMDRGYNDYALFAWLTDRGTSFVTRLKDNAITTPLAKRYIASEKDLWGVYSFEFQGVAAEACKDKTFHLVQWHDTENQRWFNFITNDLSLGAADVAELYRQRWRIELFFKKLKQNFNVQNFVGRSQNAVMNQIWAAMILSLLVEVLKSKTLYQWMYQRLFDFLSIHMLTHNDLFALIKHPKVLAQEKKMVKSHPQWVLFE